MFKYVLLFALTEREMADNILSRKGEKEYGTSKEKELHVTV